MLLLVDTFSALFRAHYALPQMSTSAGEPTSALYGLSALLLKLLREHPGAALAFAVDAPQATFRSDMYGAYKAGRPPTPDALSLQLRRLPELLAAFGVPVLRAPGFEADDVLATLSRIARERAEPAALIVSGDRDLLQLAEAPTRVHFIGQRGKPAVTYDEAAVVARFGVPPRRLPTYSALVGDTSDNLPSVPGIGPATARELLQRFGSARELYANLEQLESARLRGILAQHRAQVFEVEELARLRQDAPLPELAEYWAVPSVAALEGLEALFAQLEFKSLLPRVERLRESTRPRER